MIGPFCGHGIRSGRVRTWEALAQVSYQIIAAICEKIRLVLWRYCRARAVWGQRRQHGAAKKQDKTQQDNVMNGICGNVVGERVEIKRSRTSTTSSQDTNDGGELCGRDAIWCFDKLCIVINTARGKAPGKNMC